jgi:hypothetical protein
MATYFLCCLPGGVGPFWGHEHLWPPSHVFFLGAPTSSGSHENVAFERTTGKVAAGDTAP